MFNFVRRNKNIYHFIIIMRGENIQIVNVNCINSRTTEVTCYSSQAEKQAEGETTYEYMI